MLTVPTTSISPSPGLSDLDGRTSACLKSGMTPENGGQGRMMVAIVTCKAFIRSLPNGRSVAKNP